MLTLKQIAELLRQNRTPYIILHVKDTLKTALVGRFECNTCEENDDPVERAIEWLDYNTSLFDTGTVFVLLAKPNSKANTNSAIGPLVFVREKKEQPTFEGLGSIPDPNYLQKLGYVPQATVQAEILKKELEFIQKRFEDQLERMKEHYQLALENIIQVHNSWSPAKINELIDHAVAGYMKLTGQLPPTEPQLSGTEQTQELSPMKRKLLTEIKNLNDEQIATFIKILDKVKNLQKDAEQQQQTKSN